MKISTAGVMSMKVPTTSSRKLMVSRITTGFSESPSRAALTVCGMLAMVMIQLMPELAPISSITTAVVIPVCSRIPGSSRSWISR